jgi:hypothetical protein
MLQTTLLQPNTRDGGPDRFGNASVEADFIEKI